jgi:hypothetical protein
MHGGHADVFGELAREMLVTLPAAPDQFCQRDLAVAISFQHGQRL